MVLHKLVANDLYEFKRRRIHAITQPGRLRPIIEYVPKMRTAPGTSDLSAAAETTMDWRKLRKSKFLSRACASKRWRKAVPFPLFEVRNTGDPSGCISTHRS